MAIDIADTSGSTWVDGAELARKTSYLLDRLHLDPEVEVSIALVDETEMTRLHVEWMDEPWSTDVLSFPMDDVVPGQPGLPRPTGVLGDIVLCPAVALRQAEIAGHSGSAELELLLTHGVLHLLGFDHAGPEEHERMFTLQDQLLADWRSQP